MPNHLWARSVNAILYAICHESFELFRHNHWVLRDSRRPVTVRDHLLHDIGSAEVRRFDKITADLIDPLLDINRGCWSEKLKHPFLQHGIHLSLLSGCRKRCHGAEMGYEGVHIKHLYLSILAHGTLYTIHYTLYICTGCALIYAQTNFSSNLGTQSIRGRTCHHPPPSW